MKLILLLLLITQNAKADLDLCDWYKKLFPFSSNNDCGRKVSGRPKTANATFVVPPGFQ